MLSHIANKSLHASFIALKLIANGNDVKDVRKTDWFVSLRCLTGIILQRFKHKLAHRGWYVVVKVNNKFLLSYCCNVINLGNTVLFFPYEAYVPRYSESFGKKTINGIKCDGFLATPYDLNIGATCDRVVLISTRRSQLAQLANANVTSANTEAISLYLRAQLAQPQVACTSFWKQLPSLDSLKFDSVDCLNRELLCVSAKWIVYKDFIHFRAQGIGIEFETNSAHSLLASALALHGMFIHINCAGARVRSCLFNERLLLPEGYVSLANETIMSSSERLLCVVGVLSIDWGRTWAADSNAVFVIGSDAELSLKIAKRALSLFVLDSSALEYARLRKLSLKLKCLFLDKTAAKIREFDFSNLCRSINLLRLVSIGLVNFGATSFLKLPTWRLYIANALGSNYFWNINLEQNVTKLIGCCTYQAGARLRASYTCFHALIAISLYFNAYGFTELKTECFIDKRKANLFKWLSYIPIYSSKSNLFIKCSAIPNLVTHYAKQRLTDFGVCEFGDLNLGCKTLKFLCAISNSHIFYHLFYFAYHTLFRVSPLVVDATNFVWKVIDLNLNVVCVCGKLPPSVLNVYKIANNTFYFESVCSFNKAWAGMPARHVYYITNIIVELDSTICLRKLASGLQHYVSARCNARLRWFKQFSHFVLAVLELKCFTFDFNLFHSLCSTLETFIEANAKSVWKC
ncbi:MAG: hypothetical protein AAI978_00205 [Candidatus Hodgkinia cicadicola]